MNNYFLTYLMIINILTFIVYAIDKSLAKHSNFHKRISEKTLLIMALIGGSFGAIFSMYTFRHKTKKPKFFIGLPIIIAAQIIAFAVYFK